VIQTKEKAKKQAIHKVGATECKDCLIGHYVRANFLDLSGSKAKCKMCEDRDLNAVNLPLRELWKRLNQDYTDVIVDKFLPSINNYCPKCGELYDDGRAYECPKCKSKTVKKYKKRLDFVPNYVYKHKLNELYRDFERVFFSHKSEWLLR